MARSVREAGAARGQGARKTRVVVMIAVLVAGAARAASARADDGMVALGGVADERDRSVVGAAVAATLREAGWALSHDPVAAEDVDRLLDCSDPVRPWACVPASLGSRGIRQIFVVAVDRKQAASGAPLIVLTGKLILQAPEAFAVRQRFCEHCADDRLGRASTTLARQLLQDLAVRSGRTVLDVASTPAGARITLDGQPIGATDAIFNTVPGSHVVTVEKSGYRPETRSIVAEEGKTAAVAVALVPADRAPAAVHPSRVVPVALIGGGALAAIASGVLLDLGSRDGPDDKYRYVGATPAGALIGIAGTAALVTGAYLWWHGPASSAPSVEIAGGGVVVGWATAF